MPEARTPRSGSSGAAPICSTPTRHDAAELEAALREAIERGVIAAASVAHILDRRARAASTPPPIDVVLPDDPRVRDLCVTPHSLTAYDALAHLDHEDDNDDTFRCLVSLGLRCTADALDDIVALATSKRFSPTQFLEHIVQAEASDRTRRSVERRLAQSKLGRFKLMADFDWSWPAKIDRDAVEAALHLDFPRHAGNVVLVAPQGLGKTTIAKNIARNAALAGHSVLFLSAAQTLLDLASQDSSRALERRLRHYQLPALLVLDEIGYLSYANRNADLFFQLVSRR